MRILFFLLLFLPAFASIAQKDTIYTYFDANKKITRAANASFISKTTKENDRWHKQVFLTSNGHLYMDGYYADAKTHVPEGSIRYYGYNDKPTDSVFFANGLLKARYTFYANGQIKNYILFADSSHIAGQGGYTESGQEIPNYIVWRPAMYPDSTGWQKYIRKKTKRHLPGGYMAGLMNGDVEITFTIGTSGAVINATITKKSGFIDLDQRALATIENSPHWLPAISNNQRVSATQKQLFIFKNNEVNAEISKTSTIATDLFYWIIF